MPNEYHESLNKSLVIEKTEHDSARENRISRGDTTRTVCRLVCYARTSNISLFSLVIE